MILEPGCVLGQVIDILQDHKRPFLTMTVLESLLGATFSLLAGTLLLPEDMVLAANL